jgi:Putative serine esterase (DUF676)
MTPVHLLCLIHGMWGNPSHLAETARIIRKKADSRPNGEEDEEPIEFEVLIAHANKDSSTYDGIDWGGERLADEVSTVWMTFVLLPLRDGHQTDLRAHPKD